MWESSKNTTHNPGVMPPVLSFTTWSLVLYPISWLACLLYLLLFFSLILMRLKLNLLNWLYAIDFCTSGVFILLEVNNPMIFLPTSS